MKIRLLPVLLLTATFPFAAQAQSTGATPGGASSSDNSSTSGTSTNTSATSTGGTSVPSSSGTGATSSGTDTSSSMNSSGTGVTNTSGSAGMASTETFVTIPASGAWRVSDLQGKTVYSIDGSNIGDINDVLVSQNGSVSAVIVGVGGFLGIGEKNVAVNLNALQMAPSQMTGATGTASSTDSSTSAGTSTTQAGMAGSDRIVLNVTRDQLEKAPAFTGMNSK